MKIHPIHTCLLVLSGLLFITGCRDNDGPTTDIYDLWKRCDPIPAYDDPFWTRFRADSIYQVSGAFKHGDNSQIVFFGNSETSNEKAIYRSNLASGATLQLISMTPVLDDFDWSVNDQIIFIDQNYQIRRVQGDGGGEIILTTDGHSYLSPRWNKEGNKIAAIQGITNSHLIIFDQDGNVVQDIPGIRHTAVWLPTGDGLIFAKPGETSLELGRVWLANPSAIETLFHFPYTAKWYDLLPDGKHLAWDGLDKSTQRSTLNITDLETGITTPVYIGCPTRNLSRLRSSNDGEWLLLDMTESYFRKEDTTTFSQSRIFRIRPDGSSFEQVTE